MISITLRIQLQNHTWGLISNPKLKVGLGGLDHRK